jgi:hypothetical membrane protein
VVLEELVAFVSQWCETLKLVELEDVWLKATELCGVMTPIIVLPLILLSISYSPWFSWTRNALSDLGVHQAAILFNSSLMIGGVLALIFALGLMQILHKSKLGFAGTFVLIAAAVSLFAIGLFPETAGRIHFYVSVAFFTLMIISQLFIGAALIQKPSDMLLGIFTILAAASSIGVWTFQFSASPFRGVAIPEMFSSVAFSLWSIVLGVRLLKQESSLKS